MIESNKPIAQRVASVEPFPSRQQLMDWMRQLGLDAHSHQPALEPRILALAERLTGRSYLTAQERSALGAPGPHVQDPSRAHVARAQGLAPSPSGASATTHGLWNASEGEMAADGFVRRFAASAEGRRLRADVLYRINRLASVVREEGYDYSDMEVKEMRTLSHRHFPEMFRVQLLYSVACRPDAMGSAARLEIAKTVLRNDLLQHIKRDFFLVSYGLGSRQFDALFEMGDAHQLRSALIDAARDDGALREGLRQMGWETLVAATRFPVTQSRRRVAP